MISGDWRAGRQAATPAHDRAIAALLNDITALEFQNPETGAKMIFSLV